MNANYKAQKARIIRELREIAAEINKQGQSSALEEAILDQLLSFAKTLPPIPEGYGYEFVPSEPEYNRDADEWEVTIKAEVRRI